MEFDYKDSGMSIVDSWDCNLSQKDAMSAIRWKPLPVRAVSRGMLYVRG